METQNFQIWMSRKTEYYWQNLGVRKRSYCGKKTKILVLDF